MLFACAFDLKKKVELAVALKENPVRSLPSLLTVYDLAGVPLMLIWLTVSEVCAARFNERTVLTKNNKTGA
jgi:hypothetical protein